MNKMRIILIFLISILFFTLIVFSDTNIINIINKNISDIRSLHANNEYLVELYYFIIYIFLTTFSLPVAFIMGLLAGMIFEPMTAILVVSFASSIGATLAFILSRFIFRDFIRETFLEPYKKINDGFVKNGMYYLFAIRMSPIFPYFLVNLVSGLTTMKMSLFYLVTQIGMLPVTIIVIFIGKGLSEIILANAQISMELVILFTALGLLPLTFKYLFKRITN
tara:strand:+ start:106609 stop:107274 length:666 start_codon:yes stop_codon:yes gene_type:complete